MPTSDSDSEVEIQGRNVYPVSQVIKPLAPNDIDFNNWPCYLLEDAIAVDKHGQYTNLLEVASKGPLIIEGRLNFEEEDELLENLIKPELRNAIIRVEGVTQFSFGSRDNSADTGHVCMWGGESRHGWFEINPAARYEAAYSKSTEAVNIYYFMQSLYKLKAAASLKIEEVLYRYAALEGSGRSRQEVERTIKGHAGFLLTQMYLKEEINFPKTVFFNWLAKSCPAAMTELTKRKIKYVIPDGVMDTASIPIPPPPAHSHNVEQPEPYIRPEGEEEPIRAPQVHDDDDALEDFASQEPPGTDIPRYVAWFLELTRRNPPPKYRASLNNLAAFTVSRAATLIYTELSFSKYSAAGELIKLYRRELRAELARFPIWQTTPLYDELEPTHRIVFAKHYPDGAEAARAVTFLKRRATMQVPRNTGNKASKSKPTKSERSLFDSDASRDSFGARQAPITRQESPALPISNRRLQNPRPVVQLPAFTGSKEELRRREAISNLAKTSGDGVTPPPPPRGKTPARKPITIPIFPPKDKSLKRSHSPDEDGDHTMQNTGLRSPTPSSEDESDDDQDPVHLTLVASPSLPTHDFDSVDAENVLAKETRLTGHDAPFLMQLIAAGKERMKDREMIGGKVVPDPIRGALRGRDW